MNIKVSYIRYLLPFVIMQILITNQLYSQGTDSRKPSGNKDKLYIGISLSPLYTNIACEKPSSSFTLNYEKGISLSYKLDFGYFFSKIAGINLGAGYSSYSTKVIMDYYSTKFQTVDSENESYEMQISGTSITETQKLSFLNIPVNIILRFPAGENLCFFIEGGVSMNIPVIKTFKGAGTFTYEGYYSAYPILLQDLPTYGFPKNLNTLASGSLQIKSLNTSLCVSGGACFYLSDKLQLMVGAHYNRSMSNISAYKSDQSFRLTSKANELNSVMAGSSSVGLQAFGLNLGLRFFLK